MAFARKFGLERDVEVRGADGGVRWRLSVLVRPAVPAAS